MAIRNIRPKAVALASAAVLVGLYLAFPVYPTTLSLCELIESRGHMSGRWMTPHRGATLVLKGTLLGGPDGALAFEAACNGHPVLFAVETTPLTLATPSSSRILKTLPSPSWRREDRTVSAVIVARVSSEVQSCFGPGLVVTALAVRTEGPIVSTPNKPGRA